MWSGDVLMGDYIAENIEDAIDQAVLDGGGHEIEYNAYCKEEDVENNL